MSLTNFFICLLFVTIVSKVGSQSSRELLYQKIEDSITIDENLIDTIYRKKSQDRIIDRYIGFSHKITEDDPEYDESIDTKISGERIQEILESDIYKAIDNSVQVYPNYYD